MDRWIDGWIEKLVLFQELQNLSEEVAQPTVSTSAEQERNGKQLVQNAILHCQGRIISAAVFNAWGETKHRGLLTPEFVKV